MFSPITGTIISRKRDFVVIYLGFFFFMLSIKKLKHIDPQLNYLSDDEILQIRDSLYELGQIIYEDWETQTNVSKNPIRVLSDSSESTKLKS